MPLACCHHQRGALLRTQSSSAGLQHLLAIRCAWLAAWPFGGRVIALAADGPAAGHQAAAWQIAPRHQQAQLHPLKQAQRSSTCWEDQCGSELSFIARRWCSRGLAPAQSQLLPSCATASSTTAAVMQQEGVAAEVAEAAKVG